MKRLPLVLLLAAPQLQAWAEEATPVAGPPVPALHGYAFGNPDVLLRQRIFGLAHGIHLLLSGCLDKNANAQAVQQAYDAWHALQRDSIEAVRVSLAEHHFGARATDARWQDIARALGLKETIYPSLGGIPLPEACATLPQALTQPRYDFAAQLESANDLATR